MYGVGAGPGAEGAPAPAGTDEAVEEAAAAVGGGDADGPRAPRVPGVVAIGAGEVRPDLAGVEVCCCCCNCCCCCWREIALARSPSPAASSADKLMDGRGRTPAAPVAAGAGARAGPSSSMSTMAEPCGAGGCGDCAGPRARLLGVGATAPHSGTGEVADSRCTDGEPVAAEASGARNDSSDATRERFFDEKAGGTIAAPAGGAISAAAGTTAAA